MVNTVQNPLTPEEMDTLASRARGFFGSPEPKDLKEAMLALDPSKPDDLSKLEALKSANEELKSAVGDAELYVNRRVREVLNLKETQQQELDRWHYVHPGMM